MNRRFAVALPPLAVLAAGSILLAVSLVAWGAGSEARLPSWLTTFGGAMFALPAIVSGYVAGRSVHNLTRESFLISNAQLALGAFLFAILAVWVLIVATKIGDPDAYTGLVLEGGSSVSSTELFIVIALLTAVKSGLAAAAAYVYCGAVTAEYHRTVHREDEEDGIAELIRERSAGVGPKTTDPLALFSRPPHDRR
jgi:hypothetical protein